MADSTHEQRVQWVTDEIYEASKEERPISREFIRTAANRWFKPWHWRLTEAQRREAACQLLDELSDATQADADDLRHGTKYVTDKVQMVSNWLKDLEEQINEKRSGSKTTK